MWITLLLVFIFLMLDQGSKYLTEKLIPLGEEVEFIPNFLSFKKVYNTGAAWGMMNNATWVLVLISALGSVIFGYFLLKNNWKIAKWRSLALVLCFSGCFGNLIDRFISITPLSSARPGVVDMISFKPFDKLMSIFGLSASVFNVADFILVTGIIMILIDVIFIEDRRKKKNAKPKTIDFE